ncbi:hypothetical protein C0992_009417 [Termitomyces sp. T32_za158]|nr:hypothetical protein C0992_009417 [Termitomyces sp. T32_za158]
MLGARLKARRRVDTALRQVRIRDHRRAGPGEVLRADSFARSRPPPPPSPTPSPLPSPTHTPAAQVPELISQRRRWLNGSFFAAVHSTVHFYYIYRSAHSVARKAWIHVEMVYQFFSLVFSWFALVSACLGAWGGDVDGAPLMCLCSRSFSPASLPLLFFVIVVVAAAGQLLHRLLDSRLRTRRPVVQPSLGKDPQPRADVLLPRAAHHVLHSLAWEPPAGEQVGVYGRVYRVCGYYGIYDGAYVRGVARCVECRV